ncbi:MAG: hypothetical protein JSS84_08230 [Bacteroidetes bacterium]|nr:hypothetical protein [Bacteroidota bacterium]
MALVPFLRQIKWNRSRGSRWSDIRYYVRWARALRPGANSMDARTAWISFPAMEALDRLLNRTDRVFEYGGGGSTLFWLDRVAEVVTVEHDALWYAALENRLQQEGGRWTGFLVPATPGTLVPDPDPADPAHFASADEASQGSNYRDYVQTIDRFPDGHFDVLMIDGRARTSCLAHATPKLKHGGLLVLDNAERVHYTHRNADVLQGFEVVLEGMAPVIFNRDFSETRILRKN